MARRVNLQQAEILQGNTFYFWRALQWFIFLMGGAIIFSLIFFPFLGIHAFWNVLIPIAPLMLVLMPGLWRNICPMAFVSMIPHRLGFSRRKRLKIASQGKFMLIGVCSLYLIIPFRHVILDTNGLATAAVLLVVTLLAFIAGTKFEWKSGWCSSLCPVHAVERLYGSRPTVSFSNAQCTTCKNCVIPCPDSEPDMHPLFQQKELTHRISGILLIGGFPGFIWGWFHVPDYQGPEGWHNLITVLGVPYLGITITLTLFYLLYKIIQPSHIHLLIRVFAAAAVICYYWYRLPALIGFGIFPGDGMIVDLSRMLPVYTPYVMQIFVLVFFFSWFLYRPEPSLSWKIRPPFEKKRRAS